MTAGTLSIIGIVEAQAGIWYSIVPQLVGFLIFLIAAFAETNRTPFDLVEADAELVAGYITEYGGGRFAMYYFAEYMNMIVVSRHRDDAVPRRLAAAVRHRPAGLGRPVRRPGEDAALRLPLHLGPGDAAALRYDQLMTLRLEDPARRWRRSTPWSPRSVVVTTDAPKWTPDDDDVVEVSAAPSPAAPAAPTAPSARRCAG